MSDINNAQVPDQYTPQSQESKPQPPEIPNIRFIRTYPRRYDSSYNHHHPQELNYIRETVEIENSKGHRLNIQTYLLRVYPEKFNDYDAYMDIPMSYIPNLTPDIKKVRSSSLGKTWEVIAGPTQSPIRGYFRGDYTENNPPAWMFGLRLVQE